MPSVVGGPAGSPGCCSCYSTFVTGTAHGCGSELITGATVTITNQSTGATIGTGTTNGSGVYSIGIPSGGTYNVNMAATGNYQAYTRSVTVTTNTTATADLYPDPISTLHCCDGNLLGDTLHATVGGYAVVLNWNSSLSIWQGDFTVSTPHGVGTPDGACSNFSTSLSAVVPVRATFRCLTGQGGTLTALFPGHYGSPNHPNAFPISESSSNYPWNGPTYTNSTTGSQCQPSPWWERASADSTITSYTTSPYQVQGYLNTPTIANGNGTTDWTIWLFGSASPTWTVTP